MPDSQSVPVAAPEVVEHGAPAERVARSSEAPPTVRVAAKPQRPPTGANSSLPGLGENAIRVLVADPLVDEGKATANALAGWGIHPLLVHDGVEAILTIQRTMPAAVIIDAALPKMYGFQICEFLKRNESLRHIHVVLVGAIHNRHRYRRDPAELYGADAYLERPQLPEALWPMLRGFGLSLGSGTPDFEPTPASVSAPSRRTMPEPIAIETAVFEPVPEPQVHQPIAPRRIPAEPLSIEAPPIVAPSAAGESPSAAEPGFDAEIAKAERLARIVVSDIILYNQEKFDAAVRTGDVVAAMGADLDEGRALFGQRIDARVRESRDFLIDELVRVAAMRRSQ